MYYPKCIYCGQSDGNDDIVLEVKIEYKNNQECKIIEKRQCDICGRKYHISQTYKFDHWNYEYDYED